MVVELVGKAFLLYLGVIFYLTDLHLAVIWDLIIGILLIGLSNLYGTESPRIAFFVSGGKY